MKIIVYAISKNEEAFVNRWVKSMSEADDIYVLDTGSTDNTVSLLKELNVHVKEEVITPFRFDTARNKSLDMLPDCDICVCTDLDEVFTKGWRKTLENIWKDNNRLGYNYNWSLDENNNPLVNFYIEKIHSRYDFKWIHPVHEVLTYIGSDKEKKIYTDDITLNHYPDPYKSRSNYLPLLELSVKECPTDDRNMHYLGREYMYYNRWNDAIDTLIKHLELPSSTWKDERCASERFIGRCYVNLKRYKEANMWYEIAINEAPYLREAYIEAAMLYNDLKNYKRCEELCLKALQITKNPKTYINEVFSYNETVYDLLSISFYYQNRFEEALIYVNKALEINPKDERILNNKKLIEEKIKNINS